MDCTVSVVSQSLGFLTLKIREYFEFCPDWYHRNPAVGELVMQYYVVLRSLLRLNPTMRRCLCRCWHCQIFFLSHPRNAGRRDLACPFGCRQVQRRESSNRRSLEYYRSPKGKEKKRLHNQRRGSPRPSPLPTRRADPGSLIRQAETFDSGMMRYLQMAISLIEGQRVSDGEILRIPTRVVRQHSITRRRRIDHVLSCWNGTLERTIAE